MCAGIIRDASGNPAFWGLSSAASAAKWTARLVESQRNAGGRGGGAGEDQHSRKRKTRAETELCGARGKSPRFTRCMVWIFAYFPGLRDPWSGFLRIFPFLLTFPALLPPLAIRGAWSRFYAYVSRGQSTHAAPARASTPTQRTARPNLPGNTRTQLYILKSGKY